MMRQMDRSTPPIQRVTTVNRPVPPSRQVQRASPVTRPTISSMQKFGGSSASKELKDVLERKIEDLSRQLAEERQSARQSKLAVTRLQREITRLKSHERHHQGKEQLSKELENEKMYRVEAERRLHEMTRESENCHSRLECLQGEFKKMEGMVHEMIQYKSKIDQLKQEKSSLSTTYEANIDKFKGHITDLERENMMLLNEVKKLESQMSNKTDGRDRYKLLLERLRMVESENSSLVLENEQQRGQYEKCLDEIANQVVQALLAQKMLREECLKLQDRVQDLEHQNKQLCTVFHQRIKLVADGKAQVLADGSVYIEGSMESLHSMFSEQTADDLAGIPQMSSPPLWLKERLPGDRQSLVSFNGSITSTPDMDFDLTPEQGEFRCRTEIQTEFPATPSSPKSKHVSFVERKSETKRSSSTSSLVMPKCGPSRQRTRSTSSLSRARGLSLISPQTVSKSHESGIQNTATNEQSGLNQGVAVSANQKSSKKTVTNQNCITKIKVPLNQSHPSISNHSSQGQMSQSSSKIPTLPSGKTKDDLQVRRNSLKAEYSIRMGCQSPAIRNSPSPNPNSKPPQPRTSTQGSRSSSMSSGGQGHSRSPSVTSGGQGHSRSPSVTSGRSQSAGSKIPTVSRISVQSTKSSSTSTGSKLKTGSDKQTTVTTKLVPPKSPNLRYSGIRTTLKTDNKLVQKSETSAANNKPNTAASMSSTSANLKTVYSISPIPSSKISDAKKSETKKPAIPVRGNKPVNHRSETHFPIMGLTTLNHTSPKNDEPSNVYANISQVPSSFSSVLTRSEPVFQNGDQSESNTLTRGQYFYDYSDEDSDFREADLKRPVSTDFSAASTISLDELLDRTLENTDTLADNDFSTGFFLYPPSQKVTENELGANISSVSKSENGNQQGYMYFKQSDGSEKISEKEIEAKNRLMGKPDIVQDTEECEQRMMQQSLTLSEIPGSSMPGYRAKRPKSLILGAKEKKFLYCEYGSSSSSDTSDEERRYKISYAKNVKEQEIQSMVAKSVEAGEAKVIESPKPSNSNKDLNLNRSKKDSSDTKKTKTSQLPKPGVIKKPTRIPPPVASKPSHKISTDPKTDAKIPRPKSVEICVNTAALSAINSKTCYPFLHDSGSTDFSKSDSFTKSESETCLIKSFDKIENSGIMSNTTFDEVKVERSGSKDDGYSTMSSDIQPENLEKYSDAFESSTNSNEARNSNLSLSSQNSYSSEDRLSGHGSLGRVKAMKMKFEIENQKSPDSSPTKSPPVSPKRSLLKSPKSVPERLMTKYSERTADEVSTNPAQMSKIPKPKCASVSQAKPKSAIPLPKAMSTSAKKDHAVTKVEVNIPAQQKKSAKTTVEQVTVQSHAVESSAFSVKKSPIVIVPQNKIDTQKFLINSSCSQFTQQNSMTTKVVEEFNQLTNFPPAFDKMEILAEGYDSNSSISDRGSDLTSLHISEDNILSDIPEEKDGYESSVGIRSENTSVSSLPAINVKKQSQHMTHSVHSHHASVKFKFSTTLKRHWSSCQGLVRASSNSDYEKQKRVKQTADYDELYGGCLNIETLLERSSSESDMFTRGDKPEVILLPKLPRSKSAEHLVIDELAVEEQLQAFLKHSMMQEISKNVESADRDGETFTSFVELLMQRGHVLDSPSPLKEVKNPGLETPTALNKMTVSNFSSKGQNPSPNSFVSEERPEAELPPIWEDQKKFNSQFYSLCNTGSSRSISEKSENPNNENTGPKVSENKNLIHTCQKGDNCCKKCEEERNVNEFDNISRQIESLSKTVNQLHRSLSSLNSENTDSGSESNEGDVGISSAIGNKDIDGYQWVEDEFFLSPYGGEIILGSSPFSKTGASCDWINDYSENVEQIEEIGAEEALLEEPDIDIHLDFDKTSSKNKRNSMQNSIIADSLDEEGNFDSHHFISRRLLQEEQRRKSRSQDGNSADINITMPELMKLESTMSEVLRSRPLLKEDLRMTPEKDTDDTERIYDKKQTDMFEKMMLYGGSQDSLDDNIGVDNVMCHRLLGKGQNAVNKANQIVRPPLEFSNSQFVRYDDPEVQAMAAFDFLNEMSSSHTSDQSNEQKLPHDQLFRREERKYVTHGYQNQMNQSTTSNESRISPVKRPRRKLRQRIKKDPKVENYNQGYRKTRKFSSTSADESNDEDISLSDSFCDSYSSDDGIGNNEKQLPKPNTKMTYL